MGRVIYLPFENIPQRYTKMWNDAICKNLSASDLVVSVDDSEQQIRTGEFLDVYGTNLYKQRQLQAVSSLFKAGRIHNGDVFYVPDLFYPGLESIRYMADLSGIAIKIATFNHAGRADRDDFVQRLGPWSDIQEAAWHEQSDLIMVGSEYQAQRVREKFPEAKNRVEVVGAVWDREWMDEATKFVPRQKEHYIIWPHRPCQEKRYDLFLEIARQNPDLRFVVTSGGPSRINPYTLPANVTYMPGLTKTRYFSVFAQADGFLSTAYQETFGYTIQEAIYFGCKMVCPDYACYREYVAPESIVPFEDMVRPGYLTKLYATGKLQESYQFGSNAAGIVRRLKQL